jgi:hypothetical protein
MSDGTSGVQSAGARMTTGSNEAPPVEPEPPPKSEYLDFADLATNRSRATQFVGVFKQGTDTLLGTISWWAKWRQYTFQPPIDGTLYVFSAGCLRDIAAYIDFLQESHARSKRREKSGTDREGAGSS